VVLVGWDSSVYAGVFQSAEYCLNRTKTNGSEIEASGEIL
jgi:hypothetical protein